MENEPEISMVGQVHAITMYEAPDGMWVIRDAESGVTTQGESKLEALLMLADALADENSGLLQRAEEIFTVDESVEELLTD